MPNVGNSCKVINTRNALFQNQVLPTVVIVLCGNAVNITAHFVFIYTLKLGTK